MDVSANHIAITVIKVFQRHLEQLGFLPAVHFELEGCCRFSPTSVNQKINFDDINRKLKVHRIEGKLIPEYWQNQWEFVSEFDGQTPLKEAQNLTQVINYLPGWLSAQGIEQTLIKPVIWSGDAGQLAKGSKQIFTHEQRAVHIPNAIQMNVSVFDQGGKNIVAHDFFGEYLQQCFLETSLACCLIYMPEPDAFERLALKTKYGLAEELCSPTDISGGHQGSVALYKKLGKHNQQMGVETLLVDQFHQTLISQQNWHQGARIEHRLGAASVRYNAYFNVVYALANLIDAVEVYKNGLCQHQLNEQWQAQQLPAKMHGDELGFDAKHLFEQDNWLPERIERSVQAVEMDTVDRRELSLTVKPYKELGVRFKQVVLDTITPST